MSRNTSWRYFSVWTYLLKFTVESKVFSSSSSAISCRALEYNQWFRLCCQIEYFFRDFHSGISFNGWKRDLFGSSLLAIYMARTILITYREERCHFSKGWTKITDYVAVSKWFSRRVTLYNTPHVCGVILVVRHRLFLPSNKRPDPLIYNLYTGDSGGVYFLIKFRSFWIFSPWVEACAFRW